MPLRPSVHAVAFAIATSVLGAQTAAPKVTPELLQVGVGYAAKIAAWAVLLQGRNIESVLADELAPESAIEQVLTPLLRFEVDKDKTRLTARALNVTRTVVLRPGLGTVLLPIGAKEPELPAVEFVPQQPSELPWPRGDGPCEEVEGVDRDKLAAAVAAAFAEADPAKPALRTRAVVVVFRDRLVCEQYAPGFGKDTPLPGWSMTKSVVNALVGIRLKQGKLDLDARLPRPDWQAESDPRAALTWRHLLQMNSGLQWKENYTDPTTDAPRMLFLERAAGAFAASRPLAHDPGSRMQYSSGTTNILCEALRAGFGDVAEWLRFPHRELFTKLGMRSATLEVDPSGTFVGSSFMLATARDWARFGLLFLHDGVCHGERILPEGFVAQSLTPAPSAARGRYGLHWWLNVGDKDNPDNRPYPTLPRDLFAANGFQGQRVVVIPSRQVIVVRLGCTKNEARVEEPKLLTRILDALPGG